MEYSKKDIINFLKEWRSTNSYTTNADGSLTEQSLAKLLSDLHAKTDHMSYAPRNGGTQAVLFSDMLVDGYSAFNGARDMTRLNSKFYTVYDIDPGYLTYDRHFREALSKAVGGENPDSTVSRLISGKTDGSGAKTSAYSIELPDGTKIESLSDVVSRRMIQRTVTGKVTIISLHADPNSILGRTEIFETLSKQGVTEINGHSISTLKAITNLAPDEKTAVRALLELIEIDTINKLGDSGVYRNPSTGKVSIDMSILTGEGTYRVPDGYIKDGVVSDYTANGKISLKPESQSLIEKIKASNAELAKGVERVLKITDRAAASGAGSSVTNPYPAVSKILTTPVDPSKAAAYMTTRSKFFKGAGALGAIILVIDGYFMYKRAEQAYNTGDRLGATRIVYDWTYRTLPAFATSAAAMKLVAPFAIAMASTGFGAVPALGVELLASLAGWLLGSWMGGEIGDDLWSLLEQAGTTAARIDPIVLDISGLGITTKSVADGVYYDLDNNGFSEKTGWIDAKSGILVLDKDANGQIETGNELFGDRTILEDGKTASSGFAALAALDSNRDGVIDAKDDKFSELRIWVDRDGDGFSAPDELMTLEDAGIKSLNLSHTFVGQVDENGNTIARVGSFTRADGTTAEMKEFFLQRDTKDVQMAHSVEIPEDIMDMPELHPMGNTYSLRQAMTRDESGALKQLVQEFINDEDVTSRQAKLQDILFAWTGVTDINPKSRGSNFDARKLATLETVTGTSYRNSPTSSPGAAEAPILERSYAILAESIYTMLSMQTNLRDILRSFNYTIDLEAEIPIKLDVASVRAYLDEQLQTNETTGEKLLAEVTRALRNRGLVSDSEFTELRAYFSKKSIRYQQIIDTAPMTTLIGTDASEAMNGVVDRDNVMTSGAGNDTLNGSNRNDLLYGDDGDDRLYAEAGDDLLVGGAGNDYLRGGEGNDTYVFSKGDGVDTIVDTSGVDTIQFGEGISPDDIVAKVIRDSDGRVNLELSVKGTDDKITVYQHFGYNYDSYRETPDYQVEKVVFADGTTWDLKTIHDKAHNMSGTEGSDTYRVSDQSATIFRGLGGNDTIVGGIANDLLYGDDGDDELRGGAGNDLLYGDDGDDRLYAEAGDDLLVGGAGNDYLRGGEGNDTYVFSKGDGEDRIFDANGLADEVRLGHESIDVVFERVNSSLRVRMPGSLDAITIDSWYNGDAYKIETFKSTDGNVITHTQIESLIQAMASFQNDTGMTWEQALSEQPSQVRSIVQEYWTVPTV